MLHVVGENIGHHWFRECVINGVLLIEPPPQKKKKKKKNSFIHWPLGNLDAILKIHNFQSCFIDWGLQIFVW